MDIDDEDQLPYLQQGRDGYVIGLNSLPISLLLPIPIPQRIEILSFALLQPKVPHYNRIYFTLLLCMGGRPLSGY